MIFVLLMLITQGKTKLSLPIIKLNSVFMEGIFLIRSGMNMTNTESVTLLLLTASFGALSTPVAAQALRLPQPPMHTGSVAMAPAIADQSGFYLRGDVGVNAMKASKLSQQDLSTNGGSFLSSDASNTASVAVGAGYRINSMVRVDATYELRTGSTLKATDNVRILNSRGQTAADIYTQYNGTSSSQVGLLNAYVDIANWNGLRPFVGASIGLVRNNLSGLQTINTSTLNFYGAAAPFDPTGRISETSGGYSASKTKYGLAWGLTAGLGYEVNDRLTLEVAYRYLNLGGSEATDTINCSCGTTGQPLKVGALASHDLKMGMRWMLNDTAPRPMMPTVMTKY